jgi:hypothetical protein
MRANTSALITGLENIEAGCRAVAAFPLETLSRSDGRALLLRLDKVSQDLEMLQKRMNGRLLTMPRDTRASA